MSAPQLRPLIEHLARYEVRYVLNGSVAAMVYGVQLTPSDLDIAPDLSPDNLERSARLLVAIGAKPKFYPKSATAPSQAECDSWTPEPLKVERLDHRFVTRFGEIDWVPSNAGAYAELAPRAITVEVFGVVLQVAHADDILRYWKKWGREKDAGRMAALVELRQNRADDALPEGIERRLSL